MRDHPEPRPYPHQASSTPASASTTSPALLPPPPAGPLPIDVGTVNPNGSSAAAIARSVASSCAFVFKRPPLRFFRPVKISTYAALQAMADERGRSVSVRFVQSVIKKEGPWRFIMNHVMPPFCFNTIIGLTLFTTYTTTERALLDSGTQLHPYIVPALAGGVAGAAQSLISAPLDNLRLLRVSQSTADARASKFTGWLPLLKQALLPTSPGIGPASKSKRFEIWASRGWAMLGLSMVKDAVGFASFFAIFQIGRDFGRRVAAFVDRSVHIVSDPGGKEFVGERSWTGRVSQSCVIVLSGATAGWIYGVMAEPFEVMRRVIWQARLDWAAIHISRPSGTAKNEPLARSKKPTGPHIHCHPCPSSQMRFTNRLKLKRLQLHKRMSKIQAATNPLTSKTLPSALTILRWHFTQYGLRKLVTVRPTAGATDSNSTAGMKLSTTGDGRPRRSRVTGFKSFVLSPYSIGFFVWAVCSGDLSV